MRGWLVAGLAVLLAGCVGDNPYGDDSFGAGTPWTSWDGPIASQSAGCGGPCMGAYAEGPEFEWVGVDAGGRVLRLDWALGPPGVRMMDPALERWNATAAAAFAAGDEYAQHDPGDGVRVFAVHAWRLDEADLPDVGRRLDDARARLQPLGPPVYDCVDCGAGVLKADGLRVELMGNAPEGSGWPDLQREMNALSSWAGEQSAAQGAGQGS